MRVHPVLVDGTGRFTTAVLAGVPGVLAKNGAEGVYAAALPDGSAFALKIDDGASRAAEVLAAGLLAHLGAPGELPADHDARARRRRARRGDPRRARAAARTRLLSPAPAPPHGSGTPMQTRRVQPPDRS